MANSGSNSHLMLIVVVLAAAGVVVFGRSENCSDLDINGLQSQCGPYVGKSGPQRPPSVKCCVVVRSMSVPCACNYIKDVEKSISVEKAIFVAHWCGINGLLPGTKCGSYTIPPLRIN